MEGLLQESFNRLVSEHLSKQYTGPVEATAAFLGDFDDSTLFSVTLIIESELDFEKLQTSCQDTDEFLVVDKDVVATGSEQKLGSRFLMAIRKEAKKSFNEKDE